MKILAIIMAIGMLGNWLDSTEADNTELNTEPATILEEVIDEPTEEVIDGVTKGMDMPFDNTKTVDKFIAEVKQNPTIASEKYVGETIQLRGKIGTMYNGGFWYKSYFYFEEIDAWWANDIIVYCSDKQMKTLIDDEVITLTLKITEIESYVSIHAELK